MTGAVHAFVVDDSRAMRAILKRILVPLGFTVTEAADGHDALEKLEAATAAGTPPEVCLVDWNMPRVNGLEFVTAVRKDPRWRAITLMMVTTESEQTQIVRALAAGAHEYVIKPFPAEAIEERLRYLGLLDPAEPA